MEPTRTDGRPTHRHRWTVVDFFVVDDRPMMRQACRCGALRSIPAWDRTWEPPTD